MFEKVLVANRGEIACRVFRTLRAHGVHSVAVYSDADANAVHVRQADEAVRLGPAEPKASYLDGDAVIEAARATGAQAIHPGYGFLAENADFARRVEEAGLVFIGPTPEQALLFGDKRRSREAAKRAGVPVVPGSEDGSDDLLAAARAIGFPIIVKAALGGGGKGMQRVESEGELSDALEAAARLGASAFGSAAVYLERALDRPRHVEVQIVGDGRGQVVHLFERECSLQRRHQKVIEETPSPGIADATRSELLAAAVRLGESVHYRGAGTVEFLVTADGSFYFLEMNTRLQVEHPVTEWVTGQDLVWMQLVVAAEGRLPVPQQAIRTDGHAVEARLYAEDAAGGFLPQAGSLLRVEFPSGDSVRVDTGVEGGSAVPVQYDPILAKLSVHGSSREAAFERLHDALGQTILHGVTTNRTFLRDLSADPGVRRGDADTTYLERSFLEPWQARVEGAGDDLLLAAAAIAEAEGWLAPVPAANGGDEDEDVFADPFVTLGPWRLSGTGVT
jgi:acetyl/propionyl-CoA carboxylase alpha subunit